MKLVATVFGADCLLVIGTTFPIAKTAYTQNVARYLPAIFVTTLTQIQNILTKLSTNETNFRKNQKCSS